MSTSADAKTKLPTSHLAEESMNVSLQSLIQSQVGEPG
jgi:hypothetical protein